MQDVVRVQFLARNHRKTRRLAPLVVDQSNPDPILRQPPGTLDAALPGVRLTRTHCASPMIRYIPRQFEDIAGAAASRAGLPEQAAGSTDTHRTRFGSPSPPN